MTIAHRAAEKGKINGSTGGVGRQPHSVNEPVVAFGPPRSTEELNISVIVVPVPRDFLFEAFGGAKEVGEAIMGTITGRSRACEAKGTLNARSPELCCVLCPKGEVVHFECAVARICLAPI